MLTAPVLNRAALHGPHLSVGTVYTLIAVLLLLLRYELLNL